MSRELRRVPLDFDWPIGELWSGYLTPEELILPQCATCGGDGYSIEAKAVANTFYAHQIGSWDARGKELAWSDKLGQAEVDHLVEQGRLRTWRDGEWHSDPRTADEINAINRQPGALGLDGYHDAINRGILIEFRCERLGIDTHCPTCEGHGDIGTAEQRDAYENWTGTGPPEGDGYQLWNTTTEGHPMTPVFGTLDELCAYAAEHCTVFAHDKTSADNWRQMLDDGFVHLDMEAPDGSRIMFI